MIMHARVLPARVLPTALAALLLAACGGEAPVSSADRASPARPDSSPSAAVITDALGPHAATRAFNGEAVAVSQVLAPAGEDGMVSGDVESQTGAALRLLSDRLEAEGLTLANIVQLTVHVVVDADGAMDADGVSRAWRRSFGNRMQPAAPARTLVGVAALPAPGARVSLSALAARPVPVSAASETETP
jgi:enamine deaminase RidA (YjgF/YER057c/UK114 family)